MKRLASLLLLFLLACSVRSDCGQGCLSCAVDAENNFSCTVCDSYNDYFMKLGTSICEKVVLDNCEVPSPNYLCYRCLPGYLLDQVGGKCLKVPPISSVPNCHRYTSSGVCMVCDNGYYMALGKCEPIKEAVSECLRYSNEDHCSECNDLFFLIRKIKVAGSASITTTECVAVTDKEKCQAYSITQCDKCKTDLIINRNYLNSGNFDLTFLQGVFLKSAHTFQVEDKEGPVCVSPADTFCASIKSSTGDCLKCMAGYYFSEQGLCIKNPEDAVAHCLKYNSPNNCKECNSGYYLEGTECKPHTVVDNCAKYSTSTDVCIECNTEHFLSGSSCSPRTKIIIPQCKDLKIDADVCKECITGYYTYSDNLGCQKQIPNCQTEAENTIDASKPRFNCPTCNVDYYTTANLMTCLKQHVANCNTYTLNTNTCSGCNTGFYYISGSNTCVSEFVPNCTVPDASSRGKCTTCRTGFYKDASGVCHPYTVNNCTNKVANADECTSCDEGPSSAKIFYLSSSDKRCRPYTLTGCTTPKADEDVCDTCDTSKDYLKDPSGYCRLNPSPGCKTYNWTTKECDECNAKGVSYYLDASTKTCQQYSVEGCNTYSETENKCATNDCKANYYFDSGYCSKYDLVGCKTAGRSTTKNECTATNCEDGYYFETTSKLCQRYSINLSGCTTPMLNADGCTTCKTGYYKDTDTNNCFWLTLPGCTTVDHTDLGKCTTCDDDFITSIAPANVCFPKTAMNCNAKSTTLDECTTCHYSNGYALDSQTKSCVLTNTIGCKTFNSSSGVCQTCITGLKFNSGACEVIVSPHCLDYDISTGLCTHCEYGFYLHADGSCKINTAANCSVKKQTADECEICVKGYYSNSGTCAKISKVNCFKTSKDTDACLNCLPGFKFATGDCTTPVIPAGTEYGCLFNTDTDTCAQCKDGFFQYETEFMKVRIEGCRNASPAGCIQCEPKYELQSDGTCKNSSTTASSVKCIQTKRTQEVTLASNTQCEQCKDPNTHFINAATTFSCDVYTAANETPSCGLLDPAADGCLGCSKDYPPLTDQELSVCLSLKLASAPTLTNVDNCASIKYSTYLGGTYECGTCNPGYYFDASTPKKCVRADSTKKHAGIRLSNDNIPETVVLADVTVIDNCAKYATFESPGTLCLECKDGFVGKIFGTNFGSLKINGLNNNWDSFKQEYLVKASFEAFTECTAIASITNFPANPSVLPVTPHPFQNCESYLTESVDNTSFCLRCKPGFVGTVIATLKKASGIDYTFNPVKIFVHCNKTTTEFTKIYSSFNPGNVNPTGTTNKSNTFNTLFHYDSCPAGRHFLVFLHVSSTKYHPGYVNIGGNASPNMMCMDQLSSDHVENCQIHRIITSHDLSFQITPETAQWTCEACKPGYKMTGNFHDNTAACVLIENCEMSDPTKNTYMGNCETCKKGFSWGFASEIINFQSCVSNRGDQNCQAYDQNSKQCVLCKVGFELNGNFCVKQNVDPNCEMYSFPIHKLNTYSNNANRAYSRGWFLKHYVDKPPVTGCGRCKPGFTNVTVPKDQKVCARTSSSLHRISNCKMYNVKDLTVDDISTLTCHECDADYSLTSDKKNCIQNPDASEYQGCNELNSDSKCQGCHQGYFYQASATRCISNDDIDQNYPYFSIDQVVLKKGVRSKSNYEPNVMVPISEENPCEQYSNNNCIRCKDPRKAPLSLSPNQIAPGIIKFDCVFFPGAEEIFPLFLTNSSGNIKLSNSFTNLPDNNFIKIFTPAQKKCSPLNVSNSTCLLKDSNLLCKKCIPGYYLKDIEKTVECYPIPVKQCSEYNYSISKCTQCLSGYFLNNSFECQKRVKKDCREFSKNSDTCVVCAEGFYVGINGSSKPECMKYTVQHCAEYFNQGDYCYKCIQGYYTDGYTGVCKRFDQTGCKTVAESKNRCLMCQNDYYLNANGECELSTVSNCRSKSLTSDTCIVCDEGSYLDDNRKCKYHTASNCKSYHAHENKCTECFSNAYLKDGKCKQYTSINCLKYNPVADSCLSCANSSFFADVGGSCRSYSVKNCKQLSRSSNSCLSCVNGTFKNNNQCVEYTIENCYIFNKYVDGCIQCIDGFYLNDQMRCEAYTVQNCRVFFRHSDQCKVCNDGHYKDSNFKCHPYDINRCARFHSNENKCLSCQKGFYLENAKCIAYSVQNCREFHPFQNKCLSCNSRFYYDEDESCKPYDLQNCDLMDSQRDMCLKCSDKFFMKADSTCSPYSKTCATFNVYADECLTCQKDHHLVLGNDCKKNYIPNCLEYSQNRNECSKCQSGYLLKDKICNKYTARNCKTFKTDANTCETCLLDKFYMNSDNCLESTPIPNCMNYKTTLDGCNECVLGYYLKDNKCWKNPEGIPKCTHYNDPKTCRRCEKGMFIEHNVCIQSSAAVNNCENYIGDRKCGECEAGFLLDFNNTCSSPTNPTCATYIDLENCKTCKSNTVLKKSEANKRIECVDSEIENCFESIMEGDKPTCLKCVVQHVLNENKCTVPTTKIDGCNHYKSETECEECIQNYILAFDKKTCINDATQLDSSCHTGHLNDSPKCFLCQPGYKFDQQGSCVKCGGDGCDLCAVKGDSCRLCMKGYYMSREMVCVKYPATSLRVIEDDGTLQTEDEIESTMLHSVTSVLVGLVSALIFFSLD